MSIQPPLQPRPGINLPPKNFYVVKERDSLLGALAGMSFPQSPWWPRLADWERSPEDPLNAVVCLTHNQFPYAPKGIQLLHSIALQDGHGNNNPASHNAGIEKSRFEAARDQVCDALKKRQNVIIHCAGGTGRTGTLIGMVLRTLGRTAADVKQLLSDVNQLRGYNPPQGWPECDYHRDLIQ